MNFEHGRSTTVKTDKGWVRGFKYNGIYHFYGLDYAFANRYEIPRECDAWEGVKEATCFGYICPPGQPNRLGNHIKNPYRYWPTSDHCQNLNVWTRDLDPAKKKPVVFWLHGGGMFDGSSIEHQAYDGFQLAKKDDLCVVTINHRLNCLGYLDLSSFDEKYHRTPNLGMLDIVKALEWVQRNIAQFGGDPENVTIFGQSGGGAKVTTLLNMPAAEGLFHKAMVMSGAVETRGVDSYVDQRPIILRAMEILGIEESDVDQLKSWDQKEMLKALDQAAKEKGLRMLNLYSPKKNEDFSGNPAVYGFSEFSKKIPLIIGGVFAEFNYQFDNGYRESDTTDEEALKLLDAKFGEGKGVRLAPLFKKAFPDLKLVDLLNYQYNRFRTGTKEMIYRRIHDGCVETYNYMFAPLTKINEHSTAVHSYEIPFFFHNVSLIPSNHLDNDDVTEQVELQCAGRLANFARYGKPQLPGQVDWIPCEPDHIRTLIIDGNTRMADNYDDELVRIIQEGEGDQTDYEAQLARLVQGNNADDR